MHVKTLRLEHYRNIGLLELSFHPGVNLLIGAKAGTERYEQLRRSYQRVADHPAVQGAAGGVRARVEEFVSGRHAEAAHSPGHGR